MEYPEFGPDEPCFSRELNLKDHLIRAEQHTQRALEFIYARDTKSMDGPYRGFFYRTALLKAQSILMKLHHKEMKGRR